MKQRSLISKVGMIAIAMAITAGSSACASTTATTPPQENGMANSKHVYVLIEIKAADAVPDKLREVFTSVIRTSHKPGIVSAQVFENSAEPGRFYSLQEWESEEAFRKHMSDSSEGLDENMKLLQGPPSLSVLKPLSEVIKY